MSIQAKPWPKHGADPTRSVTPLLPVRESPAAAPAPTRSSSPARRLRRAAPKPLAIIGTPSALNRIQAGVEASILVPITDSVAPEWDRKIARVAELMQASKIGRLAVALPLPGGCYSEVALAR